MIAIRENMIEKHYEPKQMNFFHFHSITNMQINEIEIIK